MSKTKDFADASTHSGPVQVLDRKTEAPEKKTQPLRTPGKPVAALPPPDGLPSVSRATNLMRATAPPAGGPRRARMMQGMQQTAGNARLSRMLGEAIQPKLTVNTPGDPYEREADRMAEKLTQTKHTPGQPAPVSRMAASAADPVNRVATGEATGADNASLDAGLQARIQSPGGGRPLPAAFRQEMESGLGADLTGVRVHDGAVDRADADSLNAKAFTHGHHIWIGSTGSSSDRKLMAHELTHVVQQGGGAKRKLADSSGTKSSALLEPVDEQPQPEASQHRMSETPVQGELIPRSFAAQHPPNESLKNEFAVQRRAEPSLPQHLEPEVFGTSPSTPAVSSSESLDSPQFAMPAAETALGGGLQIQTEVRPAASMAPSALAPPSSGSPALPHASGAGLIQRTPDDGDDGILASIRRRINSIVDGLRSGWDQLGSMARSAFDAIHDELSGMLGGLTSFVSSALGAIHGAWAALSQRVTQITNGIQHHVQSALATVSQAAQQIGHAILRLDANALRAAWGRLTSLVSGVSQTLQQGVQAAYQAISGLWQGLRSRFDTFLNDLSGRARELFNRLQASVDGLRQRVQSAWNSLTDRASQMSGVLSGILERLKSLLSRLLEWGQEIWDGIQRQWSALTSQIGSFIQSAWARLSAVGDQLRSQATSLWDKIGGLWSRLQQWVRAQLNRLTSGLSSFWSRIRSFSIGPLIEKIAKIGQLVRLIEQAVRNPDAVMKPFVDGIANKLQAGMPAKAIETGTQKLNETAGSHRGPGEIQSVATIVVHRTPATTPTTTPAATVAPVVSRTTTSWGDIWKGFVAAVKYKWSKVHVWQMVKDMLWSLVWPWPAVGNELSELWNTDLTNAVQSLYLPRNPFADFSGFLHDLWTDLLHIVDIPLAIVRRLDNILLLLMGWITLGLMILGALFGSVAGTALGGIIAGLASLGLAAAPGAAGGGIGGGFVGAGAGFGAAMVIGEALFAAFVLLQITTVVLTLAKLWTGLQKPEEKDQDFSQLADSLIGLGTALVLFLLGWIASKLASFILDALARIPALRDPIAQFRAGARGVEKPTPPDSSTNPTGTQYGAASDAHVQTHGHAPDGQPPTPDPIASRRAGEPRFKSKFDAGEGGQKFTNEVMNHPSKTTNVQGNGRTVYHVDDLGRITGTGQDLQPVRGGTVVVEGPTPSPRSTTPPNEVVTQFPSGTVDTSTGTRPVPVLPPTVDDQADEE